MFEASDAVSVGRVIHSDVGHAVNQDKISHDLEIVPGGDSGGCYDFVHNAVAGALQLLIPKLPSLQVYPLQGSGYKIQKYPKGEGKFNWHFDALGPETQKRLLALILYLDDVEQGGETEFFYQGLKVQPKAGNAIMFPTAWTHMHCGHVPVSSDKYIVSSFFYFVI
ncbi:MAG: 2OG-Fe(II) oxygenase [Pseudomonadota bacterium]